MPISSGTALKWEGNRSRITRRIERLNDRPVTHAVESVNQSGYVSVLWFQVAGATVAGRVTASWASSLLGRDPRHLPPTVEELGFFVWADRRYQS